MLAQIRLAAGGPQLSEIQVDFAEGSKNFAVCSAKCLRVDRARRDQRSSHIPVPQDHTKRRIAFATCRSDEVGETLWIELTQEPIARLAQNRLASQLKELKIQLSALERSGHRDQPPQPILPQAA